MRLSTFITLILLTAFGTLHAESLDVIQQAYNATADLHSNGRSGQSFTSTQTASLKGIRLYLEGAGSVDSGSDIVVSLHPVISGVILSTPITTGALSRSLIEHDVVKALNVYFDQPYEQAAGETLAFTIQETSGGGSNGWNNYAMTTYDSYANGFQFYSYSDGTPVPLSSRDMAFATIIDPATTSTAVPEAFSISSPIDGSEFPNTTPPSSLIWGDSANARKYDVYLEKDAPDPSRKVATVLQNEWSINQELADGIWYWKVTARNSLGAYTCITGSFTVTPPAPKNFILYTPTYNNEYLLPAQPREFQWQRSTNATSYEIYLERGDSTPDTLVATRTNNWWSPDIALSEGTWYWKIVARNLGGSYSSSTWKFTIHLPAPGFFRTLGPSPIADKSMYKLPNQPLKISWETSIYASSYEVYFEKGNSTPTNKVATVTGTTWTVDTPLEPGQWYWKIVAKKSTGERASQYTESFHILAENIAPSDIQLESTSIDENNFLSDFVTRITTEDVNQDDEFTYSLVSGNGDHDNEVFYLVQSSYGSDARLQTRSRFNYEAKQSYAIRLRSSDQWGGWIEKSFEISVNDVDEPPFEQIRIQRQPNNSLRIEFDTEAGYSYQLQTSETMRPDDWHDYDSPREPDSQILWEYFYIPFRTDVKATFFRVERTELP